MNPQRRRRRRLALERVAAQLRELAELTLDGAFDEESAVILSGELERLVAVVDTIDAEDGIQRERRGALARFFAALAPSL